MFNDAGITKLAQRKYKQQFHLEEVNDVITLIIVLRGWKMNLGIAIVRYFSSVIRPWGPKSL